MSEISRVALFGKLDPLAYKAMESATTFCKMRGNPYVELVHWLHQVLQLQDSDVHRIVRGFDIDPGRLAADLTAALDRLPRGASSISDLSSHLEDAAERAWVYATLMFGNGVVRSGHMVVGVLKTPSLRHALLDASKQFEKIKPEALTEQFDALVSGSPEEHMGPSDHSQVGGAGEQVQGGEAGAPAAMGGQEALSRFSLDLTEQARQGELDPVVGRDSEIRQIIDILMRRRQNNPILTGEAGVGKTAVVEGLASRIASADVPPPLRDVTLRTLDLGLLQAGASMKGEFEERLKQVIEEVQSSSKPVILFIDEAHTLIGAGGGGGSADAANLLKPALARGTLRTVAATTWGEYKKHIEKDPALTRRFQVVKVDEPDEERSVRMLRRMASSLEQHHRVQILDDGLGAAVSLSHRYIPARQLPDKAVSVLDTACARVAVGLHAIPSELEDARRQIEALETEREIIDRERAVGLDTAERERRNGEELEKQQARHDALEERWQSEKALVDRILELRSALRAAGEAAEPTGDARDEDDESGSKGEALATESDDGVGRGEGDGGRQSMHEELSSLQSDLAELQGERPLILPAVDDQAVASVVAEWTGIPVGRMVRDEIQAVLRLADTLNQRVVGQRHALDMLARRIQTSRASLDNPDKPIGVFLLCGPSGVGKTETGLALAETLYGGEHNIITINMSEYQEAHTVSTLKGAPPGYVGYGEGGILTEAVRRKPYSVILLDEVEKAHPDVHEIFFQIFDKGSMEDAEGRHIDFRNTVILLTSNVGTDRITQLSKDPELMPDVQGLQEALREPLLKVFPAALLGRLVVVPYYPLGDDMLKQIVRLQLERIRQRIDESHNVPFMYDDRVVDLVVQRCSEVESGARVVDSILTNTLLPSVSQAFLSGMMEGKEIDQVAVTAADGEFRYDFG